MRNPYSAALIMATNMTVAMSAWMKVRRHGWRPIAEMGAAMYVPFLVLFVPLALGLIGTGGLMLWGHLLMLPAMAAAMLLRPHEYAAVLSLCGTWRFPRSEGLPASTAFRRTRSACHLEPAMTTHAPALADVATESATCTLDIGGMTCASCVRRVEKVLNRLDGVARRGQPRHRGRLRRVRPGPGRPGRAGRRRRHRRLHRHAAPPTRAAPPTAPAPRPTAGRRPTARSTTARDAELAGLKRKWQVTLAAGLGLMALMYLPLYHRHDGLADAGHPRRRHRRPVLGRQGHSTRRRGPPPGTAPPT